LAVFLKSQRNNNLSEMDQNPAGTGNYISLTMTGTVYNCVVFFNLHTRNTIYENKQIIKSYRSSTFLEVLADINRRVQVEVQMSCDVSS